MDKSPRIANNMLVDDEEQLQENATSVRRSVSKRNKITNYYSRIDSKTAVNLKTGKMCKIFCEVKVPTFIRLLFIIQKIGRRKVARHH